MFTHEMFAFQTTIQQMQGMVLFYHVSESIYWCYWYKVFVIDNLINRMGYKN